MGFNLEVKTDVWGVDDKSWLATMKGMTTCRSITLDVTAFHADHIVNGFIPSGIVLGKITASGLYGPYDNALSNGLEVAAGLLFDGAQVKRNADTISKTSGALFWEGVVRQSKMPVFPNTAKGEVDAPARVDLPTIRWEA